MRPELNEQRPLSVPRAALGVARSVLRTALLLAQRRIHLPRGHVGEELRFDDGTAATVYRESVVDRGPALRPAVLVVRFRLRLVRGRGHAYFRRESILNTPLFIGFPGFASKLWLAHDQNGTYRGVYEWDDAARAAKYARSLWRVLQIGCEPGTIGYRVIPGIRRDELLRDPTLAPGAEGNGWWRLAALETERV
jgi:hypothetical protein